MFRKKYIVTILDSKWNIVKNRMVFNTLPRSGEYIYFDNVYYEVINIVHSMETKHNIFLIVNKPPHQIKPSDNQ